MTEEMTTPTRRRNLTGAALRTLLPLALVCVGIGYVLDISNIAPWEVWGEVGEWVGDMWFALFGTIPSIGEAFLKVGQWLLMGAVVGVPVWFVFFLSRRMLKR